MTNPDVARLRKSTDYQPRMIGQIDVLLTRAGDAVKPLLKDAAEAASVKRRLADPALRTSRRESYECVRLLVGTELDTGAGERGLGRATDAFPRLGGRFRSDMTPAIASQLGPALEELCISGFGACAVYDAMVNAGNTELQDRDQDELIWQWISRGIGTWQGWSNTARNLVDEWGREPTARLVDLAERAGMIKGLKRKSKREDIEKCAVVVSSAGLQIFVALTPSSDGWFEM